MNSTIFKRFFCLCMLLSIVFVCVHPGLAYADSNPVVIKDDAKILNTAKIETVASLFNGMNATPYIIAVYTFKMSFSGDKNEDSYNFGRQCETMATQTTIVLCIAPGDGKHYSYYSGGVEPANTLTASQGDASKKAFSADIGRNNNDYTHATIAWLKVVADALKANPQSVSSVYNSAENTAEQNLPKILAVIVLIFSVAVALIMFVKGRRRGSGDEYESQVVVVAEEPLQQPKRLSGPQSQSGSRSGGGKDLPLLQDAKVGDVVRIVSRKSGQRVGNGLVVQKYKDEASRVKLIITHDKEGAKVKAPYWSDVLGDKYWSQPVSASVYNGVKRYQSEDDNSWDMRHDLRQMGLSYVLDD